MFSTTDIHSVTHINVGPADIEGWLRFDILRGEECVAAIEVQSPFTVPEEQRKLDLVDDLSADRKPSQYSGTLISFFEGCEVKRTRHGDFSCLTFEQATQGWCSVYLERDAQVVWYLGR